MSSRPFRQVLLTLVALSAGISTAGGAQAARISGDIRATSGEPIVGAWVFASALAVTTQTRDDGTFSISNIPAGSYVLKVYRIGYRPNTITATAIGEETTRISLRLEPTPVPLDAIVVSVSRRAENVADAPAAVTRFDHTTIGDRLGNPATELLKQAPGIDLTQVGVISSFVNGRGFNRVFNSRWVTVEDGRVAIFAETGLSIGEHTTIPKIDIAGMEVVAGPGSALYGANASGGVMSVATKDPREHRGLALEVGGGSRDFRDAQLRYAGARGRWGWKIAAQYQSARDWADTVHYPSVPPGGPALPEVPRDVVTTATRASGSLRYYMGDASYVALNAGANLRDGLGQTSQGRYRIAGYEYQNYQLLFRSPRWFAQAYRTHSNSGDTYRLQIETAAAARVPPLTADSVRSISSFPVDGRVDAVELQRNDMIGAYVRTGLTAFDNMRVTYGVQARRDVVDSYGRLYTDTAGSQPIHFDHRAAYVQVESPLAPSLRLVGAGRYDTHSRYPSRASPKVGLLYDLTPDKVLRLTYNGAFLAPSILQSDLYALNAAAGLVTVGNGAGFDIKNGSGVVVNTLSRIRPETNETWEAGFKGILGSRLYVDGTLYWSRFRDFMTLAGPINNPAGPTPTFAFDRRTGQRIEDGAGNPMRVYTFVNVGEGRFAGFDAALRYYLSDRVSLSTVTSLSRVIAIESKPTDPPEATAFNTSPHRNSLAVEFTDLRNGVQASLRARYVEGYDFRSGADWGRIPTFYTLGASASYRVGGNTSLMLQAENIASCVNGMSTPPAAGISASAQATHIANQTCGFGLRHHEILNMPAVGTTVFVGLRREWR
jgi:outer membrane receptor for ferrienterochelin and colicins